MNRWDIDLDISFEIKLRNIPDIPQWETWDFFISLINFATSIGDVLRYSKDDIPSNLSSAGTGSFGFEMY